MYTSDLTDDYWHRRGHPPPLVSRRGRPELEPGGGDDFEPAGEEASELQAAVAVITTIYSDLFMNSHLVQVYEPQPARYDGHHRQRPAELLRGGGAVGVVLAVVLQHVHRRGLPPHQALVPD